MDSDIEIRKLYQANGELSEPDFIQTAHPFPFETYTGMNPDELLTIKHKAGPDTMGDSKKLYNFILQQGTGIVSIALDLPTKMGYDSDHDFSEGKVGQQGVTINSLADVEILFKGIKLEDIFVSLNADATGFILLAFYVALAKRQGSDISKIKGAFYTRSDRYIYPLKASARILSDLSEWCQLEMHNWNLLSTSSNLISEPGSSAFQSAATDEVLNLTTGDAIRKIQVEKLGSLRRGRNPAKCDSILQGLNDRAAGEENIMPAVIEAAENNCTLGEIADTLREVYGGYG